MPDPIEAAIHIKWGNGSPGNFEPPFIAVNVGRGIFGRTPVGLRELTERAWDGLNGDESPETLKGIATALDRLESLAKQKGEVALNGCGPNDKGYQVIIPTAEHD